MSIFCSLIRECNIFRSQSTVKTLESASQLPYRHMQMNYVVIFDVRADVVNIVAIFHQLENYQSKL